MSNLFETVSGFINSIVDMLSALSMQVSERLEPILENTRPIWTDPLWQFLGLVLLCVIVVVIFYLAMRFISGGMAAVWEGLKNIIFVLFGRLVERLSMKKEEEGESQKQDKDRDQTESPELSSFWFNKASVKKAFDTIKYLTTKRDWRYQTSWFLLSGVGDHNNKEWITNIKGGRRTHLFLREKQLITTDYGWHFFDDGLVIDVEDEDNFSQAVDLISTYRPERPLDGIILTISAKTLIDCQGDETKLRKYGQQLYQKLWQLQKITGFIVPVYFVVAGCENIKGFEAFWSSWSDGHCNDMFGWSNPTRVDTVFNIRWVSEAFSSIVNSLRKAQLQVAASGNEIKDIDSFILFDREFLNLELALTCVIKECFSRSSFQEALPLRGLWFTGKVDNVEALQEDLFADKIWPEKNLAYPVQQRFFSANKVLRQFQYGSIALLSLLVLGLGIDTYRLSSYTKSSESIWESIFTYETRERNYCNSEGLSTWWLLNSLSKISQQPLTLSIPASWGGGQMPVIQERAADSIYPSILFPAYECRLRERAKKVNDLAHTKLPEFEKLNASKNQLLTYIDELSHYQYAQERFTRLAGPLPDEKDVAKDLRLLTDYLYDSTIPPSINFNSSLLLGGIMEAHYNVEWSPSELVDPAVQIDYIFDLSRYVRKQIDNKVSNPPIEGIKQAFLINDGSSYSDAIESPDHILNSLDNFHHWLQYIGRNWLSSNVDNSICANLGDALSNLSVQLIHAGYPKVELDAIVHRFSTEQCDKNVRDKLKNLNVSPFGQLFTEESNGKLEFSQNLVAWSDELEAIEKLNIISYKVIDDPDYGLQQYGAGTGAILSWDVAPLNEAIDLLVNFQEFKQRWWQNSKQHTGEPFYAPALRLRLQQLVEYLINTAKVTKGKKSSSQNSILDNHESQLSQNIAGFQRAEGILQQLSALLIQEGDILNANMLSDSIREHINYQLKLLTYLAKENNFYATSGSRSWDSMHITESLFSYSDKKAIAKYLDRQRSGLATYANNYAKPLVSYLIDFDTIAESRNDARLWYNTLLELQNYNSQQPSNDIQELENYISNTLTAQTWSDCSDTLSEPQALNKGGLFSAHYYEVNRTVRSSCNQYMQNSVVRQYLALADRFNNDLKGKFPFAGYGKSVVDVEQTVLDRFFADYETNWKKPVEGQPLLDALKTYLDKNPDSGLDGWLSFVKKIDTFHEFYQYTKVNDEGIEITLHLDFNINPKSSLGQDQVIEWKFASGPALAIFPNGNRPITWQPGEPLSLALRWATGSEFIPLSQFGTSQIVDLQTATVRFESNSQWALFEWLQRFNQPKLSTQKTNLLEFSIPVGIKHVASSSVKNPSSQKSQTYTSQLHLAMSAAITTEAGKTKYLSIPYVLPHYAPKLPGREG